MRLLLLATLSLLLATACSAQKVTLNVRNMRIDSVLTLLERQTGFSFTYVTEALAHTRPVTLHLKNKSIDQVLSDCLDKQGLLFRISGKHIVIYADEHPATTTTEFLSGIVTDEQGEAIAGALVLFEPGRKTILSGEDGSWQLPLNETVKTIRISSLGYADTLLQVQTRQHFVTRLHFLESQLDETLVIAYGRTTKRFNTGNVFRVAGTTWVFDNASSFLNALSGRVPGLQVTQVSGVPGSASALTLRGSVPLDPDLSGTEPLIIIDGIPFEQGNVPASQLVSAANNPKMVSQGGMSALNCLNPSDIESVEILKDADATAIYGSRGANGVILITTKQFRSGEPSFTVSGGIGIIDNPQRTRWMTTAEYTKLRRTALQLDGLPVNSQTAPDLVLWDTTRFLDLQHLLEGKTAMQSNLDLSSTWGNRSSQWYASLSHRAQSTVFSSRMGEEQNSFRLSLDQGDSSNTWQVQVRLYYGTDHNRLVRDDPTALLYLPPHLHLLDNQGRFTWNEGSYRFTNPLALLGKRYVYTGNFAAASTQAYCRIFSSFDLRINAGYNFFGSDEMEINPSSSFSSNRIENAFSLFGKHRLQSWIIEPQLDFRKTISFHQLELLAGFSWQQKKAVDEQIRASGYSSDKLLFYPQAAATLQSTHTGSAYRYTAAFGKISYNYARRYFLNLTGRADGSSRFGPGNKFAGFGALGMAWVFTNERWINRSHQWLSFGKLRASWGKTGNDQVGDYRYLSLWTSQNGLYAASNSLVPGSLFNSDYNWEHVRKAEIGCELGFLQDRLYLSCSWFNHRSTGQPLLANLPTITGFATIVLNYDAIVSNRGVEIAVQSTNMKRSRLSWTTYANVSFYHNRLVSFPGLAYSAYAAEYRLNEALGTRYALQALPPAAATGMYGFVDQNGDGQLNSNDYVPVANLFPRVVAGISNEVKIGDISVYVLLEGRAQDGKSYMSVFRNYPGTISNQPAFVNDFWDHSGQSTMVPRPTSSGSGLPAGAGVGLISTSSLQYEDASYIRMRELGISYQVPQRMVVKKSSKTVFIEAENVFLVSRYRGYDPENNNFYQLAPLRKFKIGFRATFK